MLPRKPAQLQITLNGTPNGVYNVLQFYEILRLYVLCNHKLNSSIVKAICQPVVVTQNLRFQWLITCHHFVMNSNFNDNRSNMGIYKNLGNNNDCISDKK